MLREAKKEDLDAVLSLYLSLHEVRIPEKNTHLIKTWEQIIDDANHHLIINEVDGQAVSSCVCIVKNLICWDVANSEFVRYLLCMK